MKILALAVLLTVMQAPPPIPRQTPAHGATGSTNIKENTAAKQRYSQPAPFAGKTQKSDDDEWKTTLINSSDGHAADQVMKLTESAGVDVAIEAVGLPATFGICQAIVAAGGRMRTSASTANL